MDNEIQQLTPEEQIAAAMAQLDKEEQEQPETFEEDGESEVMNEVLSPTLEALEVSRRPKKSTRCETCPNCVWFSTPTEVKAYCRVMYLITWSNKDPTEISGCDGVFIGQQE